MSRNRNRRTAKRRIGETATRRNYYEETPTQGDEKTRKSKMKKVAGSPFRRFSVSSFLRVYNLGGSPLWEKR